MKPTDTEVTNATRDFKGRADIAGERTSDVEEGHREGLKRQHGDRARELQERDEETGIRRFRRELREGRGGAVGRRTLAATAEVPKAYVRRGK